MKCVLVTVAASCLSLMGPAVAQNSSSADQTKDVPGTNVPLTNQNTGRLQNDTDKSRVPSQPKASTNAQSAPDPMTRRGSSRRGGNTSLR